MRVSTANFSAQAIDAIGERGERALKLQQQLSTGKRILQASDDPLGAAQAERLRAREANLAIERRMMGHAQGMLQQAEGAIASGSEIIQSVRELLIQGGNATLVADDRAKIAAEMRQMRTQLLDIANMSDGTGGFVFGGQGTSSRPFGPEGAPQYQAERGTQQTGTMMSYDTTIDGSGVFLGDGSSTPGGSVFAALDRIIDVFENPATSAAAITSEVELAGDAIDAAQSRLQTARSDVGAQLAAIESRDRLLESGEIEARSRISALSDADFTKVISDLQNQQTASEAAMKTYAQIARLNLFDFL